MSQVIDPYAISPEEPTPEEQLPPQEPDPAPADPVPPLDPDPTAPEPPEAPESVLDFRKIPIKGRMPRIELWIDEMWIPVGVWTFEHYPDLSGDDLRDLLIAKGLPEADAKWFGIQRAVRLAQAKDLAS